MQVDIAQILPWLLMTVLGGGGVYALRAHVEALRIRVDRINGLPADVAAMRAEVEGLARRIDDHIAESRASHTDIRRELRSKRDAADCGPIHSLRTDGG